MAKSKSKVAKRRAAAGKASESKGRPKQSIPKQGIPEKGIPEKGIPEKGIPEKGAEEIVRWQQVFPADANPAGNMFGGRLMEVMDSACAIAAGRYSDALNTVTASVEALSFQRPVHVSDFLRTVSKVVHTGRTSMVVRTEVYRYPEGRDPAELATSAHFIMVAMDAERKPTPVPALAVTTDEEREAWRVAQAVRDEALAAKRGF